MGVGRGCCSLYEETAAPHGGIVFHTLAHAHSLTHTRLHFPSSAVCSGLLPFGRIRRVVSLPPSVKFAVFVGWFSLAQIYESFFKNPFLLCNSKSGSV